jgi:peptidoglycan/xylan/chitin deacetylase (PgdA/CDA1 family)
MGLATIPLGAAAEPQAPCPGNPEALGTSRALDVDAATTPRVGRKHFPATLPLADREVVLTFDDGPWPDTTPAVLAALKHECVRATFFLLGRNAAAHPALAKRELAEGHTVAHHSFRHPLLDHMRPDAAMAEIDHGIAAVETAAYGAPSGTLHAPFFRFPGFASTPTLLDRLAERADRGVRRRPVGKRLEPHDPGTGIAPGHGAARRKSWWYRAFSRYQAADRSHAAGTPAQT